MPARIRRVPAAHVILWGQPVGAVAWTDKGFAEFEYDPSFIQRGLNVAPLVMPIRQAPYSFPELPRNTFYGLPGLLADSIPDRYGNALIDLWLQQQGRAINDFSPVERLCYMGTRGMGALEYKPALTRQPSKAIPLEVAELTALAARILSDRKNLVVHLKGAAAQALATIIRVGTSAGGARAKAVIAWNPETHEVRSGQVATPEGFEPWILKFDGVNDQTLGDPKGFGRIEFTYHEMAVAAGIAMTKCHLFKENGRAHFMTRRFDRDASGDKIHMQSLCAIGHYDFNAPGQYGYEHAFQVIRRLNLGYEAVQEMYRRMVFNILACNQDDHTRNISFLMNKQGKWSLSPAFDVMWAYNSEGPWTHQHQMTVNGKRTDFIRNDLLETGRLTGIKNAKDILEEVGAAIAKWPKLAKKNGVEESMVERIKKTHRLHLLKGP